MSGRSSGASLNRRPGLFALVALVLVLATAQLIEQLVRSRALEQERGGVLTELAALRARLEGTIGSHLLLVHGLTAVIAAHPDMDQQEFARIAHGLVDGRHALRNIVGAPDLIASLVYPLAGNEVVVGLNYRTHPLQAATALRALRTGRTVLAGPLPLVQGGMGIIIREPVQVVPGETDPAPRPWGIISAVVGADTLYRQAGIPAAMSRLRLALRGTDGTGAEGPVFFGDPSIFARGPVTLDVDLPGGSWQLAAIPIDGWGAGGGLPWLIRLAGLLVALIAGLVSFLLVRFNQAVALGEGRLRTLLDTIPDLVWLKDPDGVFLGCNPRFEEFVGAHEAEILGRRDHDFVPAELADAFRANDRAAIAAGGPTRNEEWLSFAHGGYRAPFDTVRTPVRDARGRLIGVLGIARDITERKEAEERIRALNRLYAVLSGINQAIVRLRDRDDLFREACRIAVEVGRLRMAWLGLVDPASGAVRPVAWAGEVDAYLEQLRVSLGDGERRGGPTGLALREGRHVVCHDIAEDPRMAPWRDAALAIGYRSSAAFPIQVAGRVVGTFNVYAVTPGFFDKTEVDLLDELAQDIGYAVEFIEANAERRRVEEDLRRQKEVLDRTSRLAKVGGWEFDALTQAVSWTDEAARIHDLEPGAQITLAEGLTFLAGPSRETMEQALRAALDEGRPYDLELAITTAKDIRKWVRTIGLPVREAGRVVRLDGAVQDITARKLAEQAAREQESMLDTVFQVLPDLFFLMDPDGTVRDYRASRRDSLYLPPEGFLGGRLQDLLPPAAAAAFAHGLERLASEDRLISYEYGLRAAGEERHFEARLSRLPEAPQLIAVVRDITERKRVEDEIRRLNAELEERVAARTAELAAINEELETFTYSVSHDLKAPLRGIDGYSRLLLEDHLERLDEEGRLFLRNVRHGVEQMGQLIDDLLAYSRMERRSLHGISLDLAELMARILAERADEIRARGATVELDLAGLAACADQDGLAMVLRNLLDNALKFSRPGEPPVVRVCGEATGDTVLLTVRDQGIGFDMQFHDRIFEIFQRLQRAEEYPGTGIGLAMVRKAVRRMGGRIWAESAPGQGATFFLELPR